MTIDRIKAVGLTAADLTTSDPYIVFSFKSESGTVVRQTAIQRQTLTPSYPDKIVFLFEIAVNRLKDASVEVEAWDHNECKSGVERAARAQP